MCVNFYDVYKKTYLLKLSTNLTYCWKIKRYVFYSYMYIYNFIILGVRLDMLTLLC